ncbi:MAG TPA: WYL domain-containing protein [Chthoniobacterales bacterium]|nr:WYL domain-containing protein [Chthoniobacterales bacterium]
MPPCPTASSLTNFSLDEFLQRTDQPRTTVTAVIRVDPVTAERVRKEAPFKIVKEERTENDVSFTIEAGNWDWYMGWFLSFGSRVTIIEPDAFRARLFEVAQATANHHGAGASTV